MVYMTPVRSDYVSGSYYDAKGEEYYLSPAKLESDYSPVRFERELRVFRRHCPRGAVLDVGCSSGAFLFQLQRLFTGDYDVLGTDASSAPLDYAESKGVPVVRGDFRTQDFAKRTFDAITFWAVLEHLSEPGRFLERAWDLLKPGGVCFVLVPNFESLAVRLLGAKYRYIYAQHLNYFTRKTLVRFVEARLKVRGLRSTHFNPMVIWQDWRLGGREVSNDERGNLLRTTTRYKSARYLRPVKWGYSGVERALGSLFLADNLLIVLEKVLPGSTFT